MENDVKIKDSKLSEKVMKLLVETQKEVEELALQFSLGKADAKDKFEEIKSNMNTLINRWENIVLSAVPNNSDRIDKLRVDFNNVRKNLSIGIAETKELFIEQRSKIIHAIENLENELLINPELNDLMEDFQIEKYKLKLKLEILKLKFELKTFKIKNEFYDLMNESRCKMENYIKDKVHSSDSLKTKWTGFSTEIQSSYKHFIKAFEKL